MAHIVTSSHQATATRTTELCTLPHVAVRSVLGEASAILMYKCTSRGTRQQPRKDSSESNHLAARRSEVGAGGRVCRFDGRLAQRPGIQKQPRKGLPKARTLPRVAVRSVPEDASAVLMDSLHSARNTRNASFCRTLSRAADARALDGGFAEAEPPPSAADAAAEETPPGSCSRGVEAPLVAAAPFACCCSAPPVERHEDSSQWGCK